MATYEVYGQPEEGHAEEVIETRNGDGKRNPTCLCVCVCVFFVCLPCLHALICNDSTADKCCQLNQIIVKFG